MFLPGKSRISPSLLVLATFMLSSWLAGSVAANERIAIPHSTIATAQGKGVAMAMLSCATTRYAHGVLGDSVEAGCLVVETEDSQTHVIELPDAQVFEDLDPRIADMDGDGSNDVVVVRSDNQGGAALAIYGFENDKLTELAATPPIGQANRWLAPIGMADFNDDGQLDVAYVQTPHIGGILKIWSITTNGFEQLGQISGFSNHSIGSKRVSTSRIEDRNGDDVPDIALPDQYRGKIVWVTLVPELAIIDVKPYQSSYFD